VSPRRAQNPPLDRVHAADDPMEQFARWFEEAEADVPLEQAMTLATVDARGSPNARMVLLKGFGPDGFRFFTNYESAKGGELGANPRAALVIYWRELDRQVRVRGRVERLSADDSDAYFASRPLDSRIAAAISPQSRPIEREELDRLFAELEAQVREDGPSRPADWGGYLVRPEEIEFWQGRDSRMHDRLLYRLGSAGWEIERLAP
jgi:pyridoxamine 5'-phosphate oxidase